MEERGAMMKIMRFFERRKVPFLPLPSSPSFLPSFLSFSFLLLPSPFLRAAARVL